MKVILTGATGFVGRYVERELGRLGIEYISLQRRADCNERVIQMDLLAPHELGALFQKLKPTHLIHLAWYTEHGKYWDSDLNLRWVLATKHLVEAFCSSGGQHIVITGTCAEYDSTYGYCVEEVTPIKPNSLYGVCKDATRNITQLVVKKHGASMSWARIFFPYGPGESSQRLLPSLFKAFKGEVLPFGVNASCYRDLLHVGDAARAILTCALSKFDGAVNICSGKPVLISEIVEAVARIQNCDSNLILGLAPTNLENNNLLVGSNKILRSLNWDQEIMLSQGIRNYQT